MDVGEPTRIANAIFHLSAFARFPALNCLSIYQKYDDTIICSESQSLLLSIDSLTPDIADIRADFDKLFSLDPVPYQHPWE